MKTATTQLFKRPVGASLCPSLFIPQQYCTVVLQPQEWYHPLLNAVNVSSGGVVRPASSSPQQMAEPLGFKTGMPVSSIDGG